MVEDECFSHILFLCNNCNYESSNKEFLTVHKPSSHEKPACNDCDNNSNLTRYLGTHGVGCHGLLPGVRIWSAVSLSAVSQSSGWVARPHLPVEYDGWLENVRIPDLLKCFSCEFEIKSPRYLHIHRETNHTQKIRSNCNLCVYKHARKQNVEYHQCKKHSNDAFKIKVKNC